MIDKRITLREWRKSPEYKKGTNLKVTKPRPLPSGCDICKAKDKATQKFIGFCGDELYICGGCMTAIKKDDKG